MIEPRSVRDVRKYLNISVCPAGKYDKYKSTAETMKNFADFKNQSLNFDRAWLNLLAMITTSRSRKYFPQAMQVSGRDDNKDRGMMQYYLASFPNERLVVSIYKTFASEQTRRSVKGMERFRRVLFKAFDDCEDRERDKVDFRL